MNTQLKILADDLWVAEMAASKLGFEFGARMTVVRLPNGTLWLHSPIESSTRLKAEIDALGAVAFLVAPHRFHYGHLAEWARLYPSAQVWSAPGLTSETAKTRIGEYLDAHVPAAWAEVFEQAVFAGNSLDNEVDFCHKPSRTLILTDLCFNIPVRRSAATRLIARFLGVLNTLSPTRPLRLATKNREASRASIRRILEWDFDRIILSHGDIIERHGKARLQTAFAWLFQK